MSHCTLDGNRVSVTAGSLPVKRAGLKVQKLLRDRQSHPVLIVHWMGAAVGHEEIHDRSKKIERAPARADTVLDRVIRFADQLKLNPANAIEK